MVGDSRGRLPDFEGGAYDARFDGQRHDQEANREREQNRAHQVGARDVPEAFLEPEDELGERNPHDGGQIATSVECFDFLSLRIHASVGLSSLPL